MAGKPYLKLTTVQVCISVQSRGHRSKHAKLLLPESDHEICLSLMMMMMNGVLQGHGVEHISSPLVVRAISSGRARVGLEFLDVLVGDSPQVVHVELVPRSSSRGLGPTGQHVVLSIGYALRSDFCQILRGALVLRPIQSVRWDRRGPGPHLQKISTIASPPSSVHILLREACAIAAAQCAHRHHQQEPDQTRPLAARNCHLNLNLNLRCFAVL
ncbi:hypothetical protein Mapa_008408 [Marchantia paleacea]|nr:hypothetical protein Mapa_008408 [Marchantia paleacea]